VFAMELTTAQRLMLLTIVASVSVASAVPAIFYPFGTSEGDTVGPIQDDGWTPLSGISLPAPGFPFYGIQRHTLFVSIVGSLSAYIILA